MRGEEEKGEERLRNLSKAQVQSWGGKKYPPSLLQLGMWVLLLCV